jgi:hypothetical protein
MPRTRRANPAVSGGQTAFTTYSGWEPGVPRSGGAPNVAAVAMANKTTRMAWAMLKNGTDYQPVMATG